MKTITFLRHYRMQEPYGNYTNLSLRDIHAIAIGSLDPATVNVTDIAKYSKLNSKSILTSSSRRSIETAQHIKMRTKARVKINIESSLCEIAFQPNNLLTTKQYKKFGMPLLRKSVMTALFNDQPYVESLASIHKRILLLEIILRSHFEDEIVCISHGFFMRFLFFHFRLHKSILTKNISFDLVPRFANGAGFICYLN